MKNACVQLHAEEEIDSAKEEARNSAIKEESYTRYLDKAIAIKESKNI